MGTQYSAQKKINWFKGHFKAAEEKGISLDKEKLIAKFCIEHLSTRRKALEIIKLFETAGIIRIFGSEIAYPELIKQETGILSTKQKSILETAKKGENKE